MRRREFITLIGGIATWPVVARAQQPALAVIGVLNGQFTAQSANLIAAFRKGLAEAGYIEGRNLAIVYRSAEADVDRLPALAKELVELQVSVLAAIGTPIAALAAKRATATIPIVFITGADPVKLGIVSSLNRPGGNATGVYFLLNELAQKRLELLHQLVPAATAIGFLVNPANPSSQSETSDVQAAARLLGLRVYAEKASSERDIDAAFANFVQERVNALFVAADAYLLDRRDQLVALAASHALPACFSTSAYVAAGGLMSYGPSATDTYRQAGLYTGRVLKGEKPGDLPVVQPTKFDLIINLKTAKALGITVPPSLLATADEVIE